MSIAAEDLIKEAERLVDSLGEGSMSATAYDTAWVARVPNPSKPDEPMYPAAYDWLLRNQNGDGSWGADIPFAHDRVICTLTAIISLSSVPSRREESAPAVRRGVIYLNRDRPNLHQDPAETVAFELLLPELARQARDLGLRLPYDDWEFVQTIKADKLRRIPPRALYGGPTPLTHSLEYLGDQLSSSLIERSQAANGSYGASPSSTAFVHMRAPNAASADYLEEISSANGGGVVDVYPINVFETAWVLLSLTSMKHRLTGYRDQVHRLAGFWTPQGVSFTDRGMVPDADDTAVAVSVLSSSAASPGTEVFELFEGPECFSCFPFERNPSVRTNAAILDAIKLFPSTPERRRMTLKIVHFLHTARIDGAYWLDKWHVSPFYATARSMSALAGLDNATVRQAAMWVLDEQQDNGSWGSAGAVEETAYAVEALVAAAEADPALERLVEPALRLGLEFLAAHWDEREHPPLWIGKALYTPEKVVRAAILGAAMCCAEHLERSAA